MPDEIKIQNKNGNYFTVSKDTEIKLDGKRYLLEKGDKVRLEQQKQQPKKD